MWNWASFVTEDGYKQGIWSRREGYKQGIWSRREGYQHQETAGQEMTYREDIIQKPVPLAVWLPRHHGGHVRDQNPVALGMIGSDVVCHITKPY